MFTAHQLCAKVEKVIKNGGIQRVIETTPYEKKGLLRLTEIDNDLIKYREALRNGKLLTERGDIIAYFTSNEFIEKVQ